MIRHIEAPFELGDGVASADVRIASGTGGLANAAGSGKFRADPGAR